MTATKLLSRWQQRLARLQKALAQDWRDCRQTGQAEAIHRLRVVLRRSRLYTRLGVSLLGKKQVKPFRDWAREVSDQLGPVRDSDMALEWLKAKRRAAPLAEKIRLHRQTQWFTARPRLKHRKPIPGALRKMTDAKRDANRLKKRLVTDLHSAWLIIAQFSAPLVACPLDQSHELRREIRRLRYLLELLIPAKQQTRHPLLRGLIAVQEALGEAQNLNVTAAALLPLTSAQDKLRLQKTLLARQQVCLRQAHQQLLTLRKSSAWKTLGHSVRARE